MTLLKKTDVAPERPVIILLYGVAGVGKSSIANTANNPILIDTDKGFDRACTRVDTIVASNWDDIMADEKLIKDYNTVVIDTAKAVLEDFLIEYVTRLDYKLKTNKQKMYGSIGEEFKDFVNRRRTENVDIIFVAHAKEKEVKDATFVFPDITGGSKELLIRIADQIGYISMVNNKRIISFDPTDTAIGKNTAQLEPMEIPDQYSAEFPTFMEELIKKVKQSIQSQTEDQKKVLQEVEKLRGEISAVKETTDADAVLLSLNDKPKTLSMPLKELLNAKVKELKFKFNKETKLFEK